jgi:hypothetical protein
MPLSFARLWQQQEYLDLDVVLWTADNSVHEDAPKHNSHLAKLPGHSILLSNSQFLQAHVRKERCSALTSYCCGMLWRCFGCVDCTPVWNLEAGHLAEGFVPATAAGPELA